MRCRFCVNACDSGGTRGRFFCPTFLFLVTKSGTKEPSPCPTPCFLYYVKDGVTIDFPFFAFDSNIKKKVSLLIPQNTELPPNDLFVF